MQEIVLQLEELFLQAVPTVLIILAFYLMMRALFFKPLLKVMAEREARRAAVLKEARNKEAAEVAAGKERVAKELAAARRDIEASVGQLAAEIARRVLQVPPRQDGPARVAR